MFQRKSTKRAREVDYTDIRTKLGLTTEAPREKITFELNKLKGHVRPWKEYGLDKRDFKEFNVEV